MKRVLFIFLTCLIAYSCQNEEKKAETKSATSTELNSFDDSLPDELKDEDCDDKLEKAEKEPVLDLEGDADAGCSIDEI